MFALHTEGRSHWRCDWFYVCRLKRLGKRPLEFVYLTQIDLFWLLFWLDRSFFMFSLCLETWMNCIFQTRCWQTWNLLHPTSQSDLYSCPTRRPTPSLQEDSPTKMLHFHLRSLLHLQLKLWTGPWEISLIPTTPLSRYISAMFVIWSHLVYQTLQMRNSKCYINLKKTSAVTGWCILCSHWVRHRRAHGQGTVAVLRYLTLKRTTCTGNFHTLRMLCI